MCHQFATVYNTSRFVSYFLTVVFGKLLRVFNRNLIASPQAISAEHMQGSLHHKQTSRILPGHRKCFNFQHVLFSDSQVSLKKLNFIFSTYIAELIRMGWTFVSVTIVVIVGVFLQKLRKKKC